VMEMDFEAKEGDAGVAGVVCVIENTKREN